MAGKANKQKDFFSYNKFMEGEQKVRKEVFYVTEKL